MLMKPTEAAAADSPRIKLGMTQKETPQEKAEAPVKQSSSKTKGNGRPGRALSRKKQAARIRGTIV
jgi:hypothetical protein